jgi:hypothetical protein
LLVLAPHIHAELRPPLADDRIDVLDIFSNSTRHKRTYVVPLIAVRDRCLQLSAFLYVWIVQVHLRVSRPYPSFAGVLSRNTSRLHSEWSSSSRAQYKVILCQIPPAQNKNRNRLPQNFYGNCISFWVQTQLRLLEVMTQTCVFGDKRLY